MPYLFDSLMQEASKALEPTEEQKRAYAEQMLAVKHQEAAQAVTDLTNKLGQAQNDLGVFEMESAALAESKNVATEVPVG